MGIDDEIRLEIKRLEKEINFLDQELEKLHKKVVQVLMMRRKKEHDLKSLRGEDMNNSEEREIQTTLARLLRDQYRNL